MRRADRLFQLVHLLRTKRFVTAEQLAEELRVSKRTVYRDIRDLQDSDVPIRGEAGVGYQLERGFELPPMSFNTAELEALVLGARMVQAFADPELAESARSALVKVEAAVPQALQQVLLDTPLFALDLWDSNVAGGAFTVLRQAIAGQRRITFDYTDRQGAPTRRTVRPLGLYFWGRSWSLASWCELRQGYRNFRADRVVNPELGPVWEDEAVTLEAFVAAMKAR